MRLFGRLAFDRFPRVYRRRTATEGMYAAHQPMCQRFCRAVWLRRRCAAAGAQLRALVTAAKTRLVDSCASV
jgi:hypothetical protein